MRLTSAKHPEQILVNRLKDQTGKNSAGRQHELENPGHRIKYDNVEILDTVESNFKLEMKELLHIVSRKTSLNKQLNPQSKFKGTIFPLGKYIQSLSKNIQFEIT